MSGHVIIATPELSDAATIMASHVTTAGPVVNLQRMQPTDLWESTSLTPYLEIDLGAVSNFNLIALLFTNARQVDTWRVRVADTQADLIADPVFDSGIVPFSPWDTNSPARHGFIWRYTGFVNRWLRIDIDSGGNPDGRFVAGRLYVSNAYRPSRNYIHGNAIGFLDTSPRDRSSAGNTVVNRQGVIPLAEFELALTDEKEYYENTRRIQQLRAGSRDVLVMLDPEDPQFAHDKIYYGLLSTTLRVTNPAYRLFSQRYEIEGLI